MNNRYLTGSLVRLRAVEPEDLEVLYSLENDPMLWDVTNFNVPYSRYAIKRYIVDCQNDLYIDRQLRLMIELVADGRVAGTIDLVDFSPRHAHCEVGISLLTEFRGYGYARQALMLLCDYAFHFLQLHQLVAYIDTDNTASEILFVSCGFKRCGLLKEWWNSGSGFKDVLMMQRLYHV